MVVLNYRGSRGQSLIYMIAFLVPISLMMAYVFNAFQISNEKTRLQNTVDAAAYSMATMEARDLNFTAYTNRAMIANQVAIAQVVGIMSWARYAQNTTRNISVVTSWIPYINAATRAIQQATRALVRGMQAAFPAISTALDGVITAIQVAQFGHDGATYLSAVEAVREVVRRNDADIDMGVSVANAANFQTFARAHGSFKSRISRRSVERRDRSYRRNFPRMEEKREIVMESRDRFSRGRNNNFATTPRVFPLPQFQLRRRGSTDLTGVNSRTPYGSWVAMDTLSLHWNTLGCGFLGGRYCGFEEWIPIGWGAAKNESRRDNRIQYNARHLRRSRTALGGSWRTNRDASSLASREWYRRNDIESIDFLGLRDFLDLSVDGLITRGPEMSLVLTKSDNNIRTNEDMNFNSRNISLENGAAMPAGSLAAMSKATPYFARADDVRSLRRSDRAREYGNLYNPYWQVRLAPLSERERRALQLAAGVTL